MTPYWFFQLRLYPWLPFLFFEAKQLRSKVPNLPSHSSLLTLGNGENRLLLLGESTVAGVGASNIQQTLTANFHRLFGEAYQIETIGKKGLQVKNAFSLFRRHEHASSDTYSGILLYLGANDCFLLTSPRQFRQQLTKLIQELETETATPWIYLASIPPVHLFPAFSDRMRSFLQTQREYLQLEMQQVAEKNPKVIFHQISMDLESDFFAKDGIHPSDSGYLKIATFAFEKLKLKISIC